MPSPFPGMDPYLEDPAFWRDFHHRFISYWSEAIAGLLPSDYAARIDERIHLVEMDPEIVKVIYPDVAISRNREKTLKSPSESCTLLMEPVTIPNQILDEVREAHIEIYHRPDRKLVTVLKLLSPTNKAGDGALEYQAKRNALFQQRVHLVEADLLVEGDRLRFARPLPVGDYFALVTRAQSRELCDVYAWNMRQRLPAIPVPLKAPDPDIVVDLQGVFETAYDRGRYAKELSYDKPPRIRLDKRAAAWVKQVTSHSFPNGKKKSS